MVSLAGLALATASVAQTANLNKQQVEQAYDFGMKLLREKRYDEALDQFKRVQQLAPQLPQGYSGEGIALALLGRPEDATKSLNKAIDLDPSFWVARRELGIIYWQLNERDQAAKELAKIAAQIPNDTVVNALLAQYEFGKHEYAHAAELFAKAPDRVQADPQLALMEAQALLETRQKGPAIDRLSSLQARPGLSPQQTFQLAWLLGRAQRYKDSISTFESLPPDFPDKYGRGYGVALASYEDQQYAKSLDVIRQLMAQGLGTPELFSLEGLVDEESGHTLEAYDVFRQGIYKYPKDDRNYLNAATLNIEHYNYEVAAEILTSGIKFIGDDYRLYLGRGVVYSMSGKLQEAELDYHKALDLAPQEGMTYAALGICYLDQNRFDKATEILRLGVSRRPEELLYYFLADSIMRTGTPPKSPAYDEALSTVEACLRINPNYALAYLQRGRLELLANNLDVAIADFEHARTLQPDSQPILYQLAVAYRRAGRTAEAAKLFAGIKQASEKQDAEWQHLNLRNILVKISTDNH